MSLADGARPVIFNNTLYKVNNENIYIDTFSLDGGGTLNRWVGSDFGLLDGIGSRAQFTSINGLTTDGSGYIYVSDVFNRAIRKIRISTREVTTVVQFGSGSNVDGSFADAKSGSLGDITMDRNGNLYFIDMTNNAVRKVFLK